MSSGFDFRDMLGGASASVSPDRKLADGLAGNGEVAGLHAHIMTKRDGMPQLVDHLCTSLVITANINELCLPALLALVVARLGQRALKELGDAGPSQREHLMDEVEAMLVAVRSGDA